MALIEISLPVPNAAALVGSYDRVLIYRATGANQPFVEVTTQQTRPVLTSDKVVYTFTDSAGAASYLYAAGLFNSTTGVVGPMGEAVSGAGDESLSLLSVSDLKGRYLFGLPVADRKGNAIPDSFFEFYIRAAVTTLARELDIAILPTVVEGETQAYSQPLASNKPLVIYTDLAPVQSIQALRFKLPYGGQANAIPGEWLTVGKDFGSIYIYPQNSLAPFTGTISSLGLGVFALEDYFPGGWQIDYVAGFSRGKVPTDILDAIGMTAALSPLAIMGDLVLPPGIGSTSLGIDGLSQSISGKGGYADRINSYLQTLANAMSSLRMRYRGALLRGD